MMNDVGHERMRAAGTATPARGRRTHDRMPAVNGARVSDPARGHPLLSDRALRTGQREVAPLAIPLVVASVIHQHLQKPLLLARALDQGQQGRIIAQEAA